MNASTQSDWERSLEKSMSDNADFTIVTVSVDGEPMKLYYLKSLVNISNTLKYA